MDEYEQTYSAEGDSGVEVKSTKGWLYLSLFIVFIFVSGIVYLANSFAKPQNISRLIITGNNVIKSNDLIKNINLNTLSTKGQARLLTEVKLQVEKNPYVDYSYVYQKNSEEIIIEIHEKKPVAIVIDDNGNSFFSSSDGTVLPYNLEFSKNDFPVIRGIDVNKISCRKLLKSALGLISGIYSKEDEHLSKSISEIIYNNDEKNFRVSLSESGKEILIGNSRDLISKSEKLKILLKNIVMDDDLADADYIDLRWKNQIVVRSRNYFMVQLDTLIKKNI